MKQSKGSKVVKSMRLSSLDGVKDVKLGTRAAADRIDRNYAESAYSRGHSDESSFADVYARKKRWGIG